MAKLRTNVEIISFSARLGLLHLIPWPIEDKLVLIHTPVKTRKQTYFSNLKMQNLWKYKNLWFSLFQLKVQNRYIPSLRLSSWNLYLLLNLWNHITLGFKFGWIFPPQKHCTIYFLIWFSFFILGCSNLALVSRFS